MADETKLQIIIEAVNQSGSQFQELTTSIQSFQTAASELARTISESFQSMTTSASESATGMQESLTADQTALKDLALAASEQTKSAEDSLNGVGQTASDMARSMGEATTGVTKDMQDASRSVGDFEKSASTGMRAASTEMDNLRGNMERGIGQIGGLIAIQQLGQSMEELGKKGEHLFDFAITQGSDFQQTMKDVQTVIASGTTTNESWNNKLQDSVGITDQLQQKALELGSRGAQSANEVGSAMDAMLRSGVDAGTVLNGAAESAQNVAIVTGDKLDESANLVTEIYHQFRQSFAENGKSIQENMKETGDVLTGTLLSARISSQDFLDTLKYVGPVASQLGSSFTDTATATALLAQNGIKGSQAGNNLKRAITSLLEPTKKGAEAMQELGLIQNGQNQLIDESTGKMKNLTDIQEILHRSMDGLTEAKKAQLIHDMFGQYALAGTLVLANENSDAFSTLREKIAGVSAEDAAANMLNTFSGHMSQLQAHVQTTAKEFGMSFIPALERLIPIGQEMLNWLQQLSPANKEFLMILLGVGSAMAIVGGALATFAISAKFAGEGMAALKGVILPAIEGFKTFAVAVREVGIAEAFMDAMSPLGWIVLIGTVVAAAAMIIMQHWGQIQPFLVKTWDEITAGIHIAWNAIKDFFVKWGIDILGVLTLGILPLVVLILSHWDQIKAYTTKVWGEITTGIQKLWTDFTTWISTAVQDTMNGIFTAFTWLYDHWYPFQKLVDFIKQTWDAISQATIQTWNAIDTFLSGVWKGISDASTRVWNAIKSFFEERWANLVSNAKTIWNPISTFFSGLWNTISGDAYTMWAVIQRTMSGLWNAIVGDGESIFNGLGTFFTGLWQQAEQWGANLIHMIAQGIGNAAHEVEQAASNVAHSIAKFLGFHSPAEDGPASDADTWAPNFVKMFADGLASGAGDVGQAAQTLISPLSDTFNGLGGAGGSPGFSNDQLAQQRDMATKIIQQKQAWEEAFKNGDQTAMDSANKLADQYRAELDKMGGDSRQFSANTTVQDAIKNVQVIAKQIAGQISTDYGKMTTSISTNLKDVSKDTSTYNSQMLNSWQDSNKQIVESTTSMKDILTNAMTQLDVLFKSVANSIEVAMATAFNGIENSARNMADQVIAAVNQAKAALASMPGSGVSASVSSSFGSGGMTAMSAMAMMAPILSSGGANVYSPNITIHASNNVTESNEKLADTISVTLQKRMKMQGKIG